MCELSSISSVMRECSWPACTKIMSEIPNCLLCVLLSSLPLPFLLPLARALSPLTLSHLPLITTSRSREQESHAEVTHCKISQSSFEGVWMYERGVGKVLHTDLRVSTSPPPPPPAAAVRVYCVYWSGVDDGAGEQQADTQ